MAYNAVDIGSAGNDHTGDPLRTAFGKQNTMLAELYALLGFGITALADADLTNGDFVHVFSDAGVIKIELADATDTTKPADGFIRADVLTGVSAIVYPLGAVNNAVGGVTAGTVYYLDVGGGITDDISGFVTGNSIQPLGFAIGPSDFYFKPETPVERP